MATYKVISHNAFVFKNGVRTEYNIGDEVEEDSLPPSLVGKAVLVKEPVKPVEVKQETVEEIKQDETSDKNALISQYEKLSGKKANRRWLIKTLKRKIAELS